MRVLLIHLAPLSRVVHAMPVVHDMLRAHPGAQIDWVVAPEVAPVLRRMAGLREVIDCTPRRWPQAWWAAAARAEWRAAKQRLQAQPYDAIVDLQGAATSARVARLARGRHDSPCSSPALRSEAVVLGLGRWAPARWRAPAVAAAPRRHALDEARALAAQALGYTVQGEPHFGLRSQGARSANACVVLAHGSAHAETQWPEENWIEFGRHCASAGHQLAVPHAGADELARAQRMAAAIGPNAVVWPALGLGDLIDRLGQARGVIGVDGDVSHLAVALGLPHVQLYNRPTAWRTGPQVAHGHRHQVSIERQPTPEVDLVWALWQVVRKASHT